MPRNLYTFKEIVLCAYAAKYDSNDLGGIDKIIAITNRSEGSIKMKIQNIAAMFDEENIPRFNKITPLSGRPHGQDGRRTNWDIVKTICQLPKEKFLDKCIAITREI